MGVSIKVTVFGAGYVGLVTGVCLSSDGNRVTVLDVDAEKIDSLNAGRCPFYEPGLDELMSSGLEQDTLSFGLVENTNTLSGVVFIAVGTPTTSNGSADLSYVRSAIEFIEMHAEPGTVVAMKSTVPPGTGNAFAARLKERGIHYVSNPEFLREGSAVTDWYQTDRVVLGGDGIALDIVRSLYRDLTAPILTCDITSAEMIKYASNAFLATKISFINEIAALCDRVGANVDHVSHGIGLDKRIGSAFLRPGIGYGGSCFPKDTRALDFLASFNGYDFHLLKAVIEVNSRQKLLPIRTLQGHFGELAGRRIAVLGLTFKPDTDDTREAPAVDIISMLAAEGAQVVAYNPIPTTLEGPFTLADSVEDAVTDASAVIITTEWPSIVDCNWESLLEKAQPTVLVYDGRNCLDPDTIRATGALYVGVGRPNVGD